MIRRKTKTADSGSAAASATTVRINGRFAPGHSGNPAGRPRETPEEVELLSRIRSLSDKAVKALESVLDDPDAPADARIKAANIVFDRQLGKPRQEIDQTVTQNQATPAEHRPDLHGIRQRIMAESPLELAAVDGETAPEISGPTMATH